jgi:SecD/SecF fusion protein
MKWGSRWKLGSAFLLALIAVGAAAFSSAGGAAAAPAACTADPESPSLELVYLLQRGEKNVTAHTGSEAAAILCSRLQKIGIADAKVSLRGDRIHIVLSRHRGSDVRRVAGQVAVPGRLGFYRWEANLIGPERVIGAHPGRAPQARALARAEHEWRVAGRPTHRAAELRLILAGAFPNVYGAVKLASEQAPLRHCAACSAPAPRFYMFGRSAARRLIAGPVSDRAALRGGERRGNVVVKVPTGVKIVSEQPSNELGEPLPKAEPGWFALRDRPELTNAEIVDPKQETDEFGLPNVTFGFTERGRAAFQRVTRAIARCGQLQVIGPVAASKAEAHSCHLAVILDGEVKTRPIINFADNPDGIDGRAGAQISGGFVTVREARDLAALLGSDSLPVDLTLVRQRPSSTQNS